MSANDEPCLWCGLNHEPNAPPCKAIPWIEAANAILGAVVGPCSMCFLANDSPRNVPDFHIPSGTSYDKEREHAKAWVDAALQNAKDLQAARRALVAIAKAAELGDDKDFIVRVLKALQEHDGTISQAKVACAHKGASSA